MRLTPSNISLWLLAITGLSSGLALLAGPALPDVSVSDTDNDTRWAAVASSEPTQISGFHIVLDAVKPWGKAALQTLALDADTTSAKSTNAQASTASSNEMSLTIGEFVGISTQGEAQFALFVDQQATLSRYQLGETLPNGEQLQAMTSNDIQLRTADNVKTTLHLY